MKKHFLTYRVTAVFTALLIAYYFVFIHPFFPNYGGKLGHDYAYFLPRILAGVYYFAQNGLSVIPWYSPSACGGMLLFANPQNLFLSVPQFLSFWLDITSSIKLTFLIFAALGLSGMYYLARYSFNMTIAASIFSATLFLFNGFFAYRLIIGHLSFHGFMLLSWIAFFLLQPVNNRWTQQLAMSMAAALLVSYIFYSGGVHLLLPSAIAIIALFILAALKRRPLSHSIHRIGLALLWVLAICAAKLNLSLATLSTFSRDFYPLPGVDNILQSLWVPVRLLFYSSYDWVDIQHIFANWRWAISRHELEYSVTFLPMVFIVLGAIKLFLRKPAFNKQNILLSLALLFVCLVPVLVNFYTPDWNAVLKKIPVVKSSSTLVRWYQVYIPIVIISAALVISNLKYQRYVVIVAVLLVVSIKAGENKSYYDQQDYDPGLIKNAHKEAIYNGKVPSIVGISAGTGVSVGKDTFVVRDELMVFGLSQLNCYEPLFGYGHEDFKKKQLLQVGKPVTLLTGDAFNMKNPACYVFPEANGCQPGDHFHKKQEDDLHHFVSYRGFESKMPMTQEILNNLSLVSFVLCLLFLIGFVIYGFFHKYIVNMRLK